jgi:hypothetical protein
MNVVTNALSSFLASGQARIGWLQTDLSHLRCPLPIVVATRRGLAVGLLPEYISASRFGLPGWVNPPPTEPFGKSR